MSNVFRFSRVLLRPVPAGALAAVLMLAPAAAAAQQPPPSLGELAKKEAERRKGLKTPGKVYTKEDLPKTGPPRVAPPADTAKAGDAAKADAAKGDAAKAKAEPEKNEEWWRARMTAAREQLRRNEMFAESLQARINALNAEYVNRDEPAQRARAGQDREKALAELARVREEKDALLKQIADIEEEARVAGVPPGWVR